jgi:hypothetical protein
LLWQTYFKTCLIKLMPGCIHATWGYIIFKSFLKYVNLCFDPFHFERTKISLIFKLVSFIFFFAIYNLHKDLFQLGSTEEELILVFKG